jgi:hypothetical protein
VSDRFKVHLVEGTFFILDTHDKKKVVYETHSRTGAMSTAARLNLDLDARTQV